MNLDLTLIVPAFLAGLLVMVTHVPLGIQVLARGIVFIDLAVAQIAGLGVIFADWLGFEPHGAGVQIAALAAALAGALALTWTDKHWPDVQEAVIGVSFILAANLAILLLASNPHGGEHLKELLVGQILWVEPRQLLPHPVVMYGDDVVDELLQRNALPVGLAVRLLGSGFEARQRGVEVDADGRAGVGQAPVAAAAVVEPELFEGA